jgi:hypothetical protein
MPENIAPSRATSRIVTATASPQGSRTPSFAGATAGFLPNRLTTLACFSLANLWFVRLWARLIGYSDSDLFLMQSPPSRAAYAALIVNVLLAGCALTLLLAGIERNPDSRSSRIRRGVFLVSLLIPLQGVRSVLALQWSSLGGKLLFYVRPSAVALSVVFVAAFLGYLGYRRHKFLQMLLTGITVLLPLVAITFAQAGYRMVVGPPLMPPNGHAPALPAHPAGTPHVVWIIFDEWDYRLTFPERKPGIQLPELDRLRETAIFAENAIPPSNSTIHSLPALLSGRTFATAPRVMDRNTLLLTASGADRSSAFGSGPTIFSRARAQGFNSGLAGWFLPYCRVIGDTLADCKWYPMERQFNTMGASFFTILPNQVRSLFETSSYSPFGRSLVVQQCVRTYDSLLADAKRLVSDRSLDLVFLHFDVPHPPYLFDRTTGKLDRSNSGVSGYLDNLVLLDRTVGAIREAMTRAGVWDSSTVLISSDHWFRSSTILDGKEDHRVPFLLKMANAREAIHFQPAFSAVVSSDLLMSILQSQVRTPSQAGAWLADHSGEAKPFIAGGPE